MIKKVYYIYVIINNFVNTWGDNMFRILVVDDNENTRKYLKAILEEEGYIVYLAMNGLDALNMLEDEHIDLVVLDIMMPKMDGYEFTKIVREVDSDLPILMVSAKQLAVDKHKGFLAGTDDYITKPIEKTEFILRIKALLRRAKIASERKIIIGSVVIDYDTLTVSGHGETIELPQKEFMLLFKLLSNPNKIFTRIQLMNEIWGMDSESGWETLTVHIGRIRKRFEGWDEFTIESVRGLGYRAVRNDKNEK